MVIWSSSEPVLGDEEKREGIQEKKSYTTPRTLLALMRLSQVAGDAAGPAGPGRMGEMYWNVRIPQWLIFSRFFPVITITISLLYIYNSCLFIFLLYLHYVQMLDELSWPYCDVTEMMVRIGASFPHGRKFQPVYQFQACECRLIQPVIVGFLKISDAWKPFKTHEIPYFLGE